MSQHEPGITIKKTRISQAFCLITFMVGELVFTERTVPLPADRTLYPGLDEESFQSTRNKVMEVLEKDREIQLGIDDSILLYQVVDIVCKCMVNDTDETLKALALQNLDIGGEDYQKVRSTYLQYAQALLEKMNMTFSKDKRFTAATQGLQS